MTQVTDEGSLARPQVSFPNASVSREGALRAFRVPNSSRFSHACMRRSSSRATTFSTTPIHTHTLTLMCKTGQRRHNANQLNRDQITSCKDDFSHFAFSHLLDAVNKDQCLKVENEIFPVLFCHIQIKTLSFVIQKILIIASNPWKIPGRTLSMTRKTSAGFNATLHVTQSQEQDPSSPTATCPT